jgi:hypothetical protein
MVAISNFWASNSNSLCSNSNNQDCSSTQTWVQVSSHNNSRINLEISGDKVKWVLAKAAEVKPISASWETDDDDEDNRSSLISLRE